MGSYMQEVSWAKIVIPAGGQIQAPSELHGQRPRYRLRASRSLFSFDHYNRVSDRMHSRSGVIIELVVSLPKQWL